MAGEDQERQLEWFGATQHTPERLPRGMPGRLSLALRHDQLVVAGIVGVIGLTVVFACGVERGRQLARGERTLLPRQHAAPRADETATGTASPPLTPTEAEAPGPPAAAPVRAPKVKPATKLAADSSGASSGHAGRSRYAVQVVTYRRLQSAKAEADRLRAAGERTFLVMRNGNTAVYVGPFPSRTHAIEKVALLRTRYRDCFVKTL